MKLRIIIGLIILVVFSTISSLYYVEKGKTQKTYIQKKTELSENNWFGNIYNIPNTSTILELKDGRIIYNLGNKVYSIQKGIRKCLIIEEDSITKIEILKNTKKYMYITTTEREILKEGSYELKKILN